MDIAATGAATTGCAWAARLLHVWISGRIQVALARVAQQGFSDRVRTLPPGSRLSERGVGREEVILEVGSYRQDDGRHG
ncbi:hypothetical protein ACH4Y0_37945 [Streptomyces sp. NPDC020707]|uniref:hypothetical protein n=1 Tax=Streptomyces sp. NPDC020707 TaxID=3365084 RepID=UPI0037A0F378